MALGATIYKATLEISDLDRGWYGTRHLTIACHPSETESRRMVRVLAFALYASDKLEFGRGISADDDADLWETNEAGDIGRWIDVGTPDNKSLRRAAGKSDDVVVLAYDDAKVEPWWASNKGDFGKINKLTILRITDEEREALAGMCSRNMHLAATIQDGTVWMADDAQNLELHIGCLMRRGEPVF